MAETEVPSNNNMETTPTIINDMDLEEPQAKKRKLETHDKQEKYKLEERLNQILCCAVCLDLPVKAVFQCSNGHLMCASCLSHLLADARLKDETATCPNCRCEISKSICIRNLAVEKAISELPASCQYCNEMLPRSQILHHEKENCQERLVQCRFERIGCPWRGPYHEAKTHEAICAHPKKPGEEVLGALEVLDSQRDQDVKLYKQIFELLSYEKITFNDLQMRPYRTDDFIPKLYYETSRFSALGSQWVVKAMINDTQKDPIQTCQRSLSYQLVLKSKVQNPIRLHYLALCGPFNDIKTRPKVYQFEFSQENMETEYQMFPILDSVECNKLLAAKNISFRLILFQVQK